MPPTDPGHLADHTTLLEVSWHATRHRTVEHHISDLRGLIERRGAATTGLSLDHREVAELARQGFTDYAGAVSRLQATIPAAVVAFLRQEGLQVISRDL
jgi:hypothetical protein